MGCYNPINKAISQLQPNKLGYYAPDSNLINKAIRLLLFNKYGYWVVTIKSIRLLAVRIPATIDVSSRPALSNPILLFPFKEKAKSGCLRLALAERRHISPFNIMFCQYLL